VSYRFLGLYPTKHDGTERRRTESLRRSDGLVCELVREAREPTRPTPSFVNDILGEQPMRDEACACVFLHNIVVDGLSEW